MKVGGIIPGFRFGKCTMELAAGLCGTPAAIHFWAEDGGSSWTGFVCEAHLGAAQELDVRDAHAVDFGCVDPRATWVFSTPERNGWCEPEGQAAAELAEEAVMTA